MRQCTAGRTSAIWAVVEAAALPAFGLPASASLLLPPLATVYLVPDEAAGASEGCRTDRDYGPERARTGRLPAPPWPSCWPAAAAAG